METLTASRVLAVVVVHDGAAWLPETLAALADQDHPHLGILAVDNGSSDDSRRILVEHLGPDRVLVSERDLGFGAAVSMALDASVAGAAEFVFLVHDDCAFDPGAVTRLVEAMEADERLAIVGPKLIDWIDPTRLQHVGMSVDVTGRAESGLEPDELDQGQRDNAHQTLYVSSCGMMVRRAVFEELGRFDRRYHLFRDDLDLCWRAWLAGHDVEIIPAAVGRHNAAAANYERLGQTAFLGPRYFAERNTLATLLKAYGAPRLLYVLPLYFLVGLAKITGFVATRRLSDAWQTARAWSWNVRNLRRTLRLRRTVQSTRLRSDAELRPLFAKVAPRMRAYVEAIIDWVAGGEPDFDTIVLEPEAEPQTATQRITTYIRRHPVTVAAILLAILVVVAVLPLLGPGSLRGGEVAPWPSDTGAFFRAYVSSWHDVGGLGTGEAPSPSQALLGLLGVLSFGSAWVASRLLILGALPLAWILALRATRIVSSKRLARLAAATAYVLSPPALAALRTGRVGALVVLALLPGLVVAVTAMVDPTRDSAGAWRSTAAASLVAATIIAFEPVTLLPVLVVVVVALLATLGLRPAAQRAILGRATAFGAAILGLLLPWSLTLFGVRSPVLGGGDPVGASADPFWRWLILVPEAAGFGHVASGVGFVTAGLLGLVFGVRRHPLAVTILWSFVLGGTYSAWALGRTGVDAWAWPGLALLVVAAGYSGLLAVAFASAGAQLTEHDFGWRQLASVAVATVVALSLVVSAAGLVRSPWSAYSVGQEALPAFIAAEEESVGQFRVLMLAQEQGVLAWDVTGPGGPSMVAHGTTRPEAFVDSMSRIVSDMMRGADPGAAGRLGLANVRYVVVPPGGTSEALDEALADQLDLEPQPVAQGKVFRVMGWLPRVAFVPNEAAAAISRRDEVPEGMEAEPLARRDPTLYVGSAPRAGAVLVSEVASNGWEALADGRQLEAATHNGLMRFDVDGPADRIVVEHDRQAVRTSLVLLQLFVVFIMLSLVLRPPRFTQGGGW